VLQLGTAAGPSDSTASQEQVVDVLVRVTQALLCGGAEGPPAGEALQIGTSLSYSVVDVSLSGCHTI